ncbi:hypothetical protein SAMN02745121_08535 [Nannocystis exedens]|uniref:Uncharacterized protein n=1 Tax=Nannocystis exedens TaxID=54 RepID=A0A1I2ICH3_9BACT|nr:hypothetical protein [Nannocystis exedens]PCC70104.1 hypothetical protein NAEX_03137 [Nannocystis exedens]SFF38807.1 hypothetical protein SAMN02745121_08535 [Nannocystis exedens]
MNEPWTTEIMRGLHDMRVGTFGAEGENVVYNFGLGICPDGRLSAQRKQSTGTPSSTAGSSPPSRLSRSTFPNEVLALLAGRCQKISYEFTGAAHRPRHRATKRLAPPRP